MMDHVYSYKPQDVITTEDAAFKMELIELLTRRRFLLGAGALGLGVIIGCGGGGGGSGTDSDHTPRQWSINQGCTTPPG